MPTAQMAPTPEVEKYATMLRTNVQMRRRVQRVADAYGISWNGAVNILISEALDARQIPEK